MTRVYEKGPQLCKGTCGRMTCHKRAQGKNPGATPRHAEGMCWACWAAKHVKGRPRVSEERVRAAEAEFAAILASRRRRGIPVEGIPVPLRRAS